MALNHPLMDGILNTANEREGSQVEMNSVHALKSL